MPSVTDVSQQSSSAAATGTNNPEKSTQQTTDSTSTDPLVQSLLLLEKKQRNLAKRKERLECFRKEEASGKELHKDQKETLAKYPEVLGQIECVKELIEQLKKIQLDASKNQKRLSKQAADEKRTLVSQRVREYAQIRYLLDHRPTSLQPEESSLLDELSSVLIPSDNSIATISRSVDTVLAIYQAGPSTTVKSLTGKTPQEVREVLDRLLKNSDTPPAPSSEVPPLSSSPPPRSLPSPPPPPPSLPTPVEQEQTKEVEEVNTIEPSSREQFSEYPLRFDTRTQTTPLEQVIQDSLFFPDDNHQEQSPSPNEFLQTLTVVNSNLTEQVSALNANPTNPEQQTDEQWQQNRRGNGNNQRNGHYHNGNRNHRAGYNNYYNQQQWPGQRGGRYDNSYGGGQRPYYENYRGRGGHNPNYRGHRGGGYRVNNRPYNNNNNNTNNNGNEYPQSAQYQHPASAPPAAQQ